MDLAPYILKSTCQESLSQSNEDDNKRLLSAPTQLLATIFQHLQGGFPIQQDQKHTCSPWLGVNQGVAKNAKSSHLKINQTI